MKSLRSSSFAFWSGSAMVAAGVALHLPMFWMGRKIGFRLVGMPMDTGMLFGMALIICVGLLPGGVGGIIRWLLRIIERDAATPTRPPS